MLEGDSADTCAKTNSAHAEGGPSRGSSMHRPWSEDPHWRERKFISSTGICPNIPDLSQICPYVASWAEQ